MRKRRRREEIERKEKPRKGTEKADMVEDRRREEKCRKDEQKKRKKSREQRKQNNKKRKGEKKTLEVHHIFFSPFSSPVSSPPHLLINKRPSKTWTPPHVRRLTPSLPEGSKVGEPERQPQGRQGCLWGISRPVAASCKEGGGTSVEGKTSGPQHDTHKSFRTSTNTFGISKSWKLMKEAKREIEPTSGAAGAWRSENENISG